MPEAVNLDLIERLLRDAATYANEKGVRLSTALTMKLDQEGLTLMRENEVPPWMEGVFPEVARPDPLQRPHQHYVMRDPGPR